MLLMQKNGCCNVIYSNRMLEWLSKLWFTHLIKYYIAIKTDSYATCVSTKRTIWKLKLVCVLLVIQVLFKKASKTIIKNVQK